MGRLWVNASTVRRWLLFVKRGGSSNRYRAKKRALKAAARSEESKLEPNTVSSADDQGGSGSAGVESIGEWISGRSNGSPDLLGEPITFTSYLPNL